MSLFIYFLVLTVPCLCFNNSPSLPPFSFFSFEIMRRSCASEGNLIKQASFRFSLILRDILENFIANRTWTLTLTLLSTLYSRLFVSSHYVYLLCLI